MTIQNDFSAALHSIRPIILFFIVIILIALLTSFIPRTFTCSYQISNDLFCINLYGYIIPLCISFILFLILMAEGYRKFGKSGNVLLILGIGSIVLAYYFPYLPVLLINNGGAEFISPLAMLAVIDLDYNIQKNNYQLAIILAYIFGFIIGASTDFVATILPKSMGLVDGIWGGGGFLDLDFLLPISLVIVVLILIREKERHTSRT